MTAALANGACIDKAQIHAEKQANRQQKLATRAAESALYASQIDELRERYRAAFGQCQDGERTAIARHMFIAAGIFERDAHHFPKRAKKAVEQMALAVFMLEAKVTG
jgi:hypothetical protein